MNRRGEDMPHYWPADSLLDLSREEGMHYLALGNAGLKRVLTGMEISGRVYRKFLKEYPNVMCEPLERYYRCRRATVKLDIHMLRDLLFAWGWREANWGAWLAALAPDVAYQQLLIQRRPTLPHGTTVIDLALASSGTKLPPELDSHFALLLGIRELLDEIPATRLPLRPNPNIEQEHRFSIETREVKSIYHGKGLAAANERMSQGIHGYYGQSHRNWLESGAPPPPAGFAIVSSPDAAPMAAQSEHSPWWKLW